MDSTPPTSDAPWYAAGLRFTCTQCGHCCSGQPGYVWVDDQQIQAIATYLDVPVGEVRHLQVRIVGDQLSLREHANGDCIYLDAQSRKCTIYPVRPIQCRTWPFWRTHLESPEAWNDVQLTCPGVNKGELIPLDVVEMQARQLKL